MEGLRLCREFFLHCQPILNKLIPDLMEQVCAGLVGEGSECFGLDDEFSRDHDFGCAFCLWWPESILQNNLQRIESALAQLPLEYEGFQSRILPERRLGRVGPASIEGFYRHFLGQADLPTTALEWMNIPEYQLAAATNGEIFVDNLGEFSKKRQELLAYYPREVWITKLAAKCMQIAQAGQYNLPRSIMRKDIVAAMLAKAEFASAALAFVALINKRYLPFYKQAGRFVANLPLLGHDLNELLQNLAQNSTEDNDETLVELEEFCRKAAQFLQAGDLSSASGNWLWEHGPSLMQHVHDKTLRRQDLLHI